MTADASSPPRQRGLGKGLAALLGETADAAAARRARGRAARHPHRAHDAASGSAAPALRRGRDREPRRLDPGEGHRPAPRGAARAGGRRGRRRRGALPDRRRRAALAGGAARRPARAAGGGPPPGRFREHRDRAGREPAAPRPEPAGGSQRLPPPHPRVRPPAGGCRHGASASPAATWPTRCACSTCRRR